MAVNFRSTNNGNLIGDILPEYIPPSLGKELSNERDINSITNGYSPERSFRKIASVDRAAMYNLMVKGIPPQQHAEYWAVGNSKNLIRFIEEFPMFKLVDKPL